ILIPLCPPFILHACRSAHCPIKTANPKSHLCSSIVKQLVALLSQKMLLTNFRVKGDSASTIAAMVSYSSAFPYRLSKSTPSIESDLSEVVATFSVSPCQCLLASAWTTSGACLGIVFAITHLP